MLKLRNLISACVVLMFCVCLFLVVPSRQAKAQGSYGASGGVADGGDHYTEGKDGWHVGKRAPVRKARRAGRRHRRYARQKGREASAGSYGASGAVQHAQGSHGSSAANTPANDQAPDCDDCTTDIKEARAAFMALGRQPVDKVKPLRPPSGFVGAKLASN